VPHVFGAVALKLSGKQTDKGTLREIRSRPRWCLWLNDGSCVRLWPERPRHAWSYDFISAATHDGRTFRLLTLIDEYTRECLVIQVARRLGSQEVIETLVDVMLMRGIPEYLRSDNGPEFVARELRNWLVSLGTGTLYIEPGSP
jgi:putative transposase